MEKYEFENRLKTAAEDPELKVTADESRLRYQVVKALIGARLAANMSEKELAKKTGIRPGSKTVLQTCAAGLSVCICLFNIPVSRSRNR